MRTIQNRNNAKYINSESDQNQTSNNRIIK